MKNVMVRVEQLGRSRYLPMTTDILSRESTCLYSRATKDAAYNEEEIDMSQDEDDDDDDGYAEDYSPFDENGMARPSKPQKEINE